MYLSESCVDSSPPLKNLLNPESDGSEILRRILPLFCSSQDGGTRTENSWSLRNHRAAENKKMERKMEGRNETQTSGSREEKEQMHVRCDSMKMFKPKFSCDPDKPVKFDSDDKTKMILSSSLSVTSIRTSPSS